MYVIFLGHFCCEFYVLFQAGSTAFMTVFYGGMKSSQEIVKKLFETMLSEGVVAYCLLFHLYL